MFHANRPTRPLPVRSAARNLSLRRIPPHPGTSPSNILTNAKSLPVERNIARYGLAQSDPLKMYRSSLPSPLKSPTKNLSFVANPPQPGMSFSHIRIHENTLRL